MATLIETALTLVLVIITLLIGLWIGKKVSERAWLERIDGERKDAVKRSRAVIGGQFSEQLAPYLPDFPYLPTESKFLGKPIDFIVFKGMDEKRIQEVVFLEVKSGKAQLSSQEKALKQAIKTGKVKWKQYRIPEKLTE
jgi:predicted Holliday junction resolvase-like endonuclease